jgi:integrase/recombinase XerD
VFVTEVGHRVQRVAMPFGETDSWTVLDGGWSVVEPAEAFLAHLHAVERSPNTVKAYAHDLRDFFEFLGQAGLGWASVRLEDVGRFVAWLRLPPVARRDGVVALPGAGGHCSASTVNRKLSAVARFTSSTSDMARVRGIC